MSIRPAPREKAETSPWWTICDREGHPPMTVNVIKGLTWCLCGLVIHPHDPPIDMELHAQLRAERFGLVTP